MIKYKTVKSTEKVPDSIICDVCGKEYFLNKENSEDVPEIQEFVKITHHCGYSSIFGDGNIIKLEICQHCLKKLLGKYIRVEE